MKEYYKELRKLFISVDSVEDCMKNSVFADMFVGRKPINPFGLN